jgi:hypothetical protein
MKKTIFLALCALITIFKLEASEASPSGDLVIFEPKDVTNVPRNESLIVEGVVSDGLLYITFDNPVILSSIEFISSGYSESYQVFPTERINYTIVLPNSFQGIVSLKMENDTEYYSFINL